MFSQKEVREGLGCQGNLDRLSAKTHAATNLATLGILAAARGAATIGLFYKGILAAGTKKGGRNKGILDS